MPFYPNPIASLLTRPSRDTLHGCIQMMLRARNMMIPDMRLSAEGVPVSGAYPPRPIAADAEAYRRLNNSHLSDALGGDDAGFNPYWLTRTDPFGVLEDENATDDDVIALLIATDSPDLAMLQQHVTYLCDLDPFVSSDNDDDAPQLSRRWRIVMVIDNDTDGVKCKQLLPSFHSAFRVTRIAHPGIKPGALLAPFKSERGIYTETMTDMSWINHLDKFTRYCSRLRWNCAITCGAPEQAMLRSALLEQMWMPSGRCSAVCNTRKRCRRKVTCWDQRCAQHVDNSMEAQGHLDIACLRSPWYSVRRSHDNAQPLCQYVVLVLSVDDFPGCIRLRFCSQHAVTVDDSAGGFCDESLLGDASLCDVKMTAFCTKHVARLVVAPPPRIMNSSYEYV